MNAAERGAEGDFAPHTLSPVTEASRIYSCDFLTGCRLPEALVAVIEGGNDPRPSGKKNEHSAPGPPTKIMAASLGSLLRSYPTAAGSSYIRDN